MAPSMNLLENRHVLLTGATRGIGRSLALRLAGEKVNLSICGRDMDALSRVEAEAAEGGAASVFARPFDLAEAAAIVDFCREAAERCGDVDVLVNNAGFNSRKAPVYEVDVEEFDAILAVNLRAPFVFVRAVLPAMTARGSGHIVNVLSTVRLTEGFLEPPALSVEFRFQFELKPSWNFSSSTAQSRIVTNSRRFSGDS